MLLHMMSELVDRLANTYRSISSGLLLSEMPVNDTVFLLPLGG